jgi:hypothetical protein
MKTFILAALTGLAAIGASPVTQAQVSINLGIGAPLYAPPPVVYVAPRPVYRAPPPVVYRGGGNWGNQHRQVVVVHHDDHHDHHDNHNDHHDDHHH